jgi:FMN phosphatase YigB (HAD superfamily)
LSEYVGGHSDSVRLPLLARLPCGVRGVLFDLGNVLHDDTVWRRWLLRLLQHLGLQTHYRGFFRIWDREHLDAVYRGRQTFGEAFAAFLLSLGLSRGQIEEVQAACRARRRELEGSMRPLPGVRSTLARLVDGGWTLGILCNSEHSAPRLREQLTRCGMGPWFPTVVSSVDLQSAMPDAKCYAAALAEMHLTATDVVFVGHDSAELAGAAAAGIATVAFNFDPDARADCYLNRFEDLLEVLPWPHAPLAAAG